MRNHWLEAESSEEAGETGYDSENAEHSRAPKRRRISSNAEDYAYSNDASEDVESCKEEEQQETMKEDVSATTLTQTIQRPRDRADHEKSAPTKSKDSIKDPDQADLPPPRLFLDSINSTKESTSKTGVIYLSRIPPFMKPSTLRSLLSSYGPIIRVFLTPEAPAAHTARFRSGGNKKHSFTDGWVEFKRKKDAKCVAETLNASIVGGKKGGWYHDDVWNIKYLRGFRWKHLTEQISNENAERASRLRMEISQTTRENKRFVQNVEMAKMLEGMEVKKRKKIEPGKRSDGLDVEERADQKAAPESKRQFRQNEVKPKSSNHDGIAEQSKEVKRILNKIF